MMRGKGPASVVELLSQRAREKGDADLYVFLDGAGTVVERRSYRAQAARAASIGKTLQSCSRPGDRALLLLPSGLHFMDAFFGCLYARRIAVPMYPPASRDRTGAGERLCRVAEDALPTVVLTTSAYIGRRDTLIQNAPSLAKATWIAVDAADDIDAPSDLPLQIDPEDVAVLQYTSGSVSHPKGVMVRHRNILANERAIAEVLGGDDAGVTSGASWLPPQHDMGLIGAILQPLYLGCWSSFMRPVDFVKSPSLWLRVISEQRATTISAPDFAYRLCVERCDDAARRRLDLSCVRTAMVGAERVRSRTLEKFAAAFSVSGFRRDALRPVYGLAEATLLVTGVREGRSIHVRWLQRDALERNTVLSTSEHALNAYDVVGLGTPPTETEVVVVSPVTHTECTPSSVGEIWVRGPSVTAGYWQQEGLSSDVFNATVNGRTGYLRTGDLGFLAEDGELFVTGRLKELIILRGRNLYPEDLEATAAGANPAVLGQAAAFGWPTDEPESVVIVQEANFAKRVDFAALAADVARRVMSLHDAVVSAVCLVPLRSLPQTQSGKLKRSLLAYQFVSGQLARHIHWSNATSAMRADDRFTANELQV